MVFCNNLKRAFTKAWYIHLMSPTTFQTNIMFQTDSFLPPKNPTVNTFFFLNKWFHYKCIEMYSNCKMYDLVGIKVAFTLNPCIWSNLASVSFHCVYVTLSSLSTFRQSHTNHRVCVCFSAYVYVAFMESKRAGSWEANQSSGSKTEQNVQY